MTSKPPPTSIFKDPSTPKSSEKHRISFRFDNNEKESRQQTTDSDATNTNNTEAKSPLVPLSRDKRSQSRQIASQRPHPHLSIATINTHSFCNTNYQCNYEALKAFLMRRRFDIICLQQCYHVEGKHSGGRGHRRQQRQNAMAAFSQQTHRIKSLAQSLNYFYVFGDSVRSSYGNVILSRYQMIQSENCQVLGEDERVRALLRVRLRIPLEGFRTSTLHNNNNLEERGDMATASSGRSSPVSPAHHQEERPSSSHSKGKVSKQSQLIRTASSSSGVVSVNRLKTRQDSSSRLFIDSNAKPQQDSSSESESNAKLSRSSSKTSASLNKMQHYQDIDVYTTDLTKGHQQAVQQLRQMLQQMVEVQSRDTPHIICGDFDSLCLEDYSIEYLNRMKRKWRQNKMDAAQFDLHFMMEKMGYLDAFRESRKDDSEACQDEDCATRTLGQIPVRTDFIWLDPLLTPSDAESPLQLVECTHENIKGVDRRMVHARFLVKGVKR